MLSKARKKEIRALALKKNRDALHAFVAEGPKVVEELLGHFPLRRLVATEEWAASHPALEVETAGREELRSASFQDAPQEVLAIFSREEENEGEVLSALPQEELCLALDGVQNPGNVGAILRVANWFGLRHVLLSPDSADPFSPKAVQAAMGALARVKTHTLELPAFLSSLPQGTPVYGTFLHGESLWGQALEPRGLIVMGSEGRGVRPEVEAFVTQRLFIPGRAGRGEGSESLNVATAAALVVAEFIRREETT